MVTRRTFLLKKPGIGDRFYWWRMMSLLAFESGTKTVFGDAPQFEQGVSIGGMQEAASVLRIISACLRLELVPLPPVHQEDPHIPTCALVYVVGKHPQGGMVAKCPPGSDEVILSRFVLNGEEVMLKPGDEVVRTEDGEAIKFRRPSRHHGEPLFLSHYPSREDPYQVKCEVAFPVVSKILTSCTGLVLTKQTKPKRKKGETVYALRARA